MINDNTVCSAVRNVNSALDALINFALTGSNLWRKVSPRGMLTIEIAGMMITQYENPRERVLFHPIRDANPFFHFMESLWIMAGREDVQFLAQFNSNIANYSDDGNKFHAPYGYRLRHHFGEDQIVGVIETLRMDKDSRQAVMAIWDPGVDLNVKSKDIPCNDLIMFKIRDDRLNMTVCCRSNDAIWGAYGANAVQFSVLQEFIAVALGVHVGTYRQVSDSFHIYVDTDVWKRLADDFMAPQIIGAKKVKGLDDPYVMAQVRPYPLLDIESNWLIWISDCERFCNGQEADFTDPFWHDVAVPIRHAWRLYKEPDGPKNHRIDLAQSFVTAHCRASDWKRACIEWLERRREK